MKSLFEAYDLRGRRLGNRIVMAPMTRARARDGVADCRTAIAGWRRWPCGGKPSPVRASRQGMSEPLPHSRPGPADPSGARHCAIGLAGVGRRRTRTTTGPAPG